MQLPCILHSPSAASQPASQPLLPPPSRVLPSALPTAGSLAFLSKLLALRSFAQMKKRRWISASISKTASEARLCCPRSPPAAAAAGATQVKRNSCTKTGHAIFLSATFPTHIRRRTFSPSAELSERKTLPERKKSKEIFRSKSVRKQDVPVKRVYGMACLRFQHDRGTSTKTPSPHIEALSRLEAQ